MPCPCKSFAKLNEYELEDQEDELIRKYHEFTGEPGESFTELFNRFNKLVNELRFFGRTCGNHEINTKFLKALPSSWHDTGVAIRMCNNMSAMPFEKLYEKLETYEMEDRKEILIRKYHKFIAKPEESLTEVFDRFNRLVNDLRLLGRTCDNREVNLKFIQALPRSYDKWAVPIRTCNDMNAMPLEVLYGKLKAYEMEDRKEVLIRKYHKFIARPGESLTELFDRFNRLVNDLRLLGRTCDNREVNLKFIQALPSFYDKWAVPIRTCNDMNAMPLEVLYGKLKAYELEDQQRKELREYNKNKALVADSDNSDMCSRSRSKLRSKLYTSKH